MHTVSILGVIFGGTIMVLAIIGGTLITIVKIIKGGVSRKGQRLEAEEAGIIQEIYQSLSTMEKRVEALETLLLDRERKDRR